MPPPSPIKILSVVEATTMNAVAKGTLDFYRTAREFADAGEASIEGRVVTFARGGDLQDQPNEFVRTFRDDGIEVEIIPERRRFDLSVLPSLRKLVEAHQPDIVVTNSVKSHFLMWRSRLWRAVPWIAFHHGYTATDRKMRVYNRLDRWSLPKADLVVTVCRAFALELAGITGIPVEKLLVQHNAIRPPAAARPTDIDSLRQRCGLTENEKIILSIGRLSKEKAHIDLIDAFANLSAQNPDLHARLMIVGDGPERGRLQAAANTSACRERISFVGQVSDVAPFYAIADVFVLPSHSEGSPNVLLEAMAANVPVVATSVGGVPEIVENDTSALLIPVNDPAAMALAISRLLNDPSLANRLTSVASGLIRRNHSPELYARSLIGLYREIATQRRTLEAAE
jgi:glycosyltransferase involved in cell wall biosynthesis